MSPHAVATACGAVPPPAETSRREDGVLREAGGHRGPVGTENEKRCTHVVECLRDGPGRYGVVVGRLVGVGRDGAPDELPFCAHRRPASGCRLVSVVPPVAGLRSCEHLVARSVACELVEDRRRFLEPGGDVLVGDVGGDANVRDIRSQRVEVMLDRVRQRELVAKPLAERVRIDVEREACRRAPVGEERETDAHAGARGVNGRCREVVDLAWDRRLLAASTARELELETDVVDRRSGEPEGGAGRREALRRPARDLRPLRLPQPVFEVAGQAVSDGTEAKGEGLTCASGAPRALLRHEDPALGLESLLWEICEQPTRRGDEFAEVVDVAAREQRREQRVDGPVEVERRRGRRREGEMLDEMRQARGRRRLVGATDSERQADHGDARAVGHHERRNAGDLGAKRLEDGHVSGRRRGRTRRRPRRSRRGEAPHAFGWTSRRRARSS